jgi:hypothetical protein
LKSLKESTKNHRKEKPPAGTGGFQHHDTTHNDYITSFRKSGVPLSSDKGLSICHIFPRPVLVQPEPYLELAIDGSYCQVAVTRGKALKSEKRKNAKRGKVRTFSRRSRLRLMKLLSKLDHSKIPLFITLTYPEHYPTAKKAKSDFKAFAERLMRLAPFCSCIWKLEFQERGAPHFHLLVWGLERFDLHWLRKWVSRAWYEVVGSGDEKHLKAGTNVQKIRSWRGVMAYASKYLGKEVEAVPDEEPGRFWGVWNRKSLPWSKRVRVSLGWETFFKIRRMLARLCRRSLKGYEREWGFWAMVDVGVFLKFLESLEGG